MNWPLIAAVLYAIPVVCSPLADLKFDGRAIPWWGRVLVSLAWPLLLLGYGIAMLVAHTERTR